MSAVIPKCQHDADAAVGHVQHTHSQSHRKMNYSFSFMAFVDGGSGCRCRKIKTSLRDKQVSSPLQRRRREEELLDRFQVVTPKTPQLFGSVLPPPFLPGICFWIISLWKCLNISLKLLFLFLCLRRT